MRNCFGDFSFVELDDDAPFVGEQNGPRPAGLGLGRWGRGASPSQVLRKERPWGAILCKKGESWQKMKWR